MTFNKHVCLFGLLPALALAAPARAALPITVPRLNYQIARLPNGLKIITLEDHRAPVVTLQLWYRVGSKDEPSGKAGFAHMFEHLMFKGSAHVASEQHARYVEEIGGEYNANTYFDRTLFFETVPSNALERVLWLEADRMASLAVDQKNMVSERAVVEEEHRMDVENAPYGTLMERIQAMIFPPRHPYAHATIGIMSDLDRASLADVKAFHRDYYKPDNTTLVLVGDFQRPRALASIKRFFGPIPHSTKAFVRYPALPVRQTAPRKAVLTDKLATLPMVVMAYRIPRANHPDTPVFDVMEMILSSGKSSRLYRSLVRDKQLAVRVSGGSLNLRLAGVFFFDAIVNAGRSPQDVENALQEQTDLMRSHPVSPAELAKAKNQALKDHVFGLLSTEQKAESLGEADLLYDTPEEVNREYAEIAAVTAADIQRVAKKYFAPQGRNEIIMMPAPHSS